MEARASFCNLDPVLVALVQVHVSLIINDVDEIVVKVGRGDGCDKCYWC